MSDKKYIEANDLLKHLPNEPYKGAIRRVLQQTPAADVAPVVHGRWNEINQIATGLPWKYRCNDCGCLQEYKHNFCPNCGCRMDGEEGESDGTKS